MQAPNVLMDIMPSAGRNQADRTAPPDRGDDRKAFRDAQEEARSGRSSSSDRRVEKGRDQASLGLGEEVSAPAHGVLTAVEGKGEKLPDVAETAPPALDIDALVAQTGLSEDDVRAALSALEEKFPEYGLVEGLVGLSGEEGDLLAMGAQPGLVIQPAVTTQLAMQSAGAGSLKLNLSQAIQAVLGEGKSAESGESLMRMVAGAAAAADAGDTMQGRSGASEHSLLMQQATNGLRLGEARDPAGSLKHYTTSLETPVDSKEEWSEKMAGKVSWLTNQGLQSAEIHLNPAEFGPVEVRIQVHNDQASVTIQAQNASVREMLETNSQRLKEMLEENGLDLSRFDVSDQTAQGYGGQGQASEGQPDGERRQADPGSGEGIASQEGESVTTGELHVSWSEGVDIYA